MKLYRLTVTKKLMDEYLREHYFSLDTPWLEEDIENIEYDELCAKYEQAKAATELLSFRYKMQDEDLIILTDGKRAYLGDMGDYYYVEATNEEFDSELPKRCHRRGVTWLKELSLQQLSTITELQRLLFSPHMLAKYDKEVTSANIEALLTGQYMKSTTYHAESGTIIDQRTILEAIDILKQALKSEDVERRERAAIAILQYAKS